MANHISPVLDELLVKLQFLSMIQPGLKPNVNNGLSFSHSQSWFGSIYRYIYGESKDKFIYDLRNIIDRAIDALVEYQDNPKLQATLANYLYASRNGIHNLLMTYKHDPEYIAKLKVLVHCMDLQLEKYRHLLDHQIYANVQKINVTPAATLVSL